MPDLAIQAIYHLQLLTGRIINNIKSKVHTKTHKLNQILKLNCPVITMCGSIKKYKSKKTIAYYLSAGASREPRIGSENEVSLCPMLILPSQHNLLSTLKAT